LSRSGSANRIAVALATVLLGACVARPETGVSSQTVEADIVFGAKAPDPPVPANADAPTVRLDQAADPGEVSFEDEDVMRDDKRFLARIPRGVTPPKPCPDAGPTDFARQEAPLNAEGTPAAGVYRWKRAGTQELTTLPGIKLPISGFERRLVRNVQTINPSDFRFDVAQTELGGTDVIVTTYRVRTAAASTRVPSTDTRTGELDRGLSIEKIERFDAKTGQSKGRAFQPQPPVLLLPLPVIPGERFQSVGVDPSNLQTMQIDGQVTRRQQVDACGELVDGWAVETTRTVSGTDTPSGKYNLVVATQLGAMPVLEFIEAQNSEGKVSATLSLGQLKPDPPTAAPA
jgi:hypothetical protein